MPSTNFRTPAFDAFLLPAGRHRQIWRLLVGIVVVGVVYAVWLALLLGALVLALGGGEAVAMTRRMVTAVDPAATLLLLLTFVGMAGGVAVAARLMQRRGFATLIGRAPVVLRDFVRAVLVVACVYVLIAIPWLWAYEPRPNLAPGLWLALLPLSLAGVLVQTLAEELAFRGYLMAQLAARFRSPLIWLFLPALVFGLLHFDPRSHGANTFAVIAAVTVFGLVAGDLTRRTGSLGAAWGVHFANNFLALLILGTPGAIPGLALWTTPYDAADVEIGQMLLGDVASMVVIWAILVRILRR